MKYIISLIFISIFLFSGCIEAITLGLQATDQGQEDTSATVASALCRMRFAEVNGSDAETCNALTVKPDGKTYNCEFNEQRNNCSVQSN